MTQEFVLQVASYALFTAFKIVGPLLLVGMAVGIAVALLQAVTQVHEMTLTFVPKILAVAITVALMLPWMLDQLLSFTRGVFSMIPVAAH
ncbi:MAG TPA: flagellar biosynthesis protein FliQ [Candidatus Latescibacteria bacterium]|nr:flagellar biosynthesis protein FliQ [Candidatus Latescibacterota bacterium]